MQVIRIALYFVICLSCTDAEEPEEQRIGGRSSVADHDRFDANCNLIDVAHWTHAGIEGGIPARGNSIIVRTITPDDDIHQAVEQAGKAYVAGDGIGGPVVLMLGPGAYRLERRLDVPSGVIVRGAGPEATTLEVGLRCQEREEREIVGVRMLNCTRSALEDLAIVHPVVKAMDPRQYQGYANDHQGIDDLKVGHVFIGLSRNCWIQNCHLLYAGTDPVIINNSEHITMRDNQVKWCFNKGGEGNGYYLIHKSHYVLCFNETIEGLRHFVIQTGSSRNVIIDCTISGDLNFHSDDGGHNLVERCRIIRPPGHPWGPIGYWKSPRGDNNLFWANQVGDRYCKDSPAVAGKIAKMSTGTENDGGPTIRILDCPAPVHGTLYPVTGNLSLEPTGN
jgi:hypothetical protein